MRAQKLLGNNMLGLLIFGLWQFHFTTGSYDPTHPPRQENFDPAEANPAGQVYCLGNPQVDMPSFGDFNPSWLSLRKLCVKPQYRGGAPGFHAGGFCFMGERLAFDSSPGAQTHPALTNPRFWYQCSLRCFCGTQYDSLAPTVPPPNWRIEHPQQVNYLIKADVVDDFVIPARGQAPPEKTMSDQYNAMSITLITEIGAQHIQARYPHSNSNWISRLLGSGNYRKILVSLDPANHLLSCSGRVPGFNLWPLEFDGLDMTGRRYPNPLLAICASAIDGGSE